jgi:hypothetical protein
MIGLLAVGAMAAGVFLMKRAADRFAAAKRRAGEWDENGPKHPTEPSYTTVGRVRILNVAANLKPEVDADGDVEELRERDLPGIAELVQRILELLLDGSQPSHEALRGQLQSIQLGDIDLANRTMQIRVVVPASAPRCTPPELQGGAVEIHLAGVMQPPTAGAVVHDGCFSAVIIDTFETRWPRDAEVISLRLIEPLVPTESSEESAT